MVTILKTLAVWACALTMMAVPAAAQRELQIDPDVEWTHPHSGIVVPTSLAGANRTKAHEFAPDFLNISFSFETEGVDDQLSLYIYRDTNGAVPVWFEQAKRGIEGRDIYGNPQLAFGVEAYAWPDHSAWQGQRAVYATPESRVATSTGLVLFSVKGWYVKLRATSPTKNPEELAQWIDLAFAGLTPPETEFSQQPVVAIAECAEKLEFKKKAKDAKTDDGASLLGSLLGGLVANKVAEEKASEEPGEPVTWCRDGELNRMQVAYRANESTDSYLIALGDSGIGVSVAPDSLGMLLSDDKGKKDERFSISVITEDQRINFVPQNRLPSFKRVLDVINDNRRVGSVSTWGEDSTVQINSDAL